MVTGLDVWPSQIGWYEGFPGENEQVGAFFDRHLVFFGTLAASTYLALKRFTPSDRLASKTDQTSRQYPVLSSIYLALEVRGGWLYRVARSV